MSRGVVFLLTFVLTLSLAQAIGFTGYLGSINGPTQTFSSYLIANDCESFTTSGSCYIFGDPGQQGAKCFGLDSFGEMYAPDGWGDTYRYCQWDYSESLCKNVVLKGNSLGNSGFSPPWNDGLTCFRGTPTNPDCAWVWGSFVSRSGYCASLADGGIYYPTSRQDCSSWADNGRNFFTSGSINYEMPSFDNGLCFNACKETSSGVIDYDFCAPGDTYSGEFSGASAYACPKTTYDEPFCSDSTTLAKYTCDGIAPSNPGDWDYDYLAARDMLDGTDVGPLEYTDCAVTYPSQPSVCDDTCGSLPDGSGNNVCAYASLAGTCTEHVSGDHCEGFSLRNLDQAQSYLDNFLSECGGSFAGDIQWTQTGEGFNHGEYSVWFNHIKIGTVYESISDMTSLYSKSCGDDEEEFNVGGVCCNDPTDTVEYVADTITSDSLDMSGDYCVDTAGCGNMVLDAGEECDARFYHYQEYDNGYNLITDEFRLAIGESNCGPNVLCNQDCTCAGGSPNPVPTADFDWSPSSPDVGMSVLFDGSLSVAGAGATIDNYEWFVDGVSEQSDASSSFSYVFTSPNTYDVNLVVTNNYSETDGLTQQVTVINSADPEPTADLVIVSSPPYYTGVGVTFDASGSDAGVGAEFSEYRFIVDGILIETGFEPSDPGLFTHQFTSAGVHTVSVAVLNNYSRADMDDVSLTLQTPPVPTARAVTVTPEPHAVDQTIQFSGSTSSAGVGADFWRYQWYVDGNLITTGYSSNAPGNWYRSFSSAGTHAVRLRITNNYSMSHSDTEWVHILTVPENCSNSLDDDSDLRNDTADVNCLLPADQTVVADMDFVNCLGTNMDASLCFASGPPYNSACELLDPINPPVPEHGTYRYCSVATDGPRSGSWGVSAENGTRVVWNGSEYVFELIPEVCDNGFDDDHDGFVDCADPDCQVTSAMDITQSEADGEFFCGTGNGAFNGNGYECVHTLGTPPHAHICCGIGLDAVWDSGSSTWSCQYTGVGEHCGNGIDDDGNGLFDCGDPACHDFAPGGGVPLFPAQSCENSPQDSDYCYNGSSIIGAPPVSPNFENCTDAVGPGGNVYYCGEGTSPSLNVSFCCPNGYVQTWYEPGFGNPGYWTCAPSAPCYTDLGTLECRYDYFDPLEIDQWKRDSEVDATPSEFCVFYGDFLAGDESKACCPVASYGGFDYYSDSGNVRVI